MNKMARIILCVLMAFSSLTSATAADASLSSGDFEYALSGDGTAVITRYKGTSAFLQLPEALDSHPVTVVGASAFRENPALAGVILPDSITAIGDQAFYNCVSLSDLTLPPFLISIGELSFAYCESLKNVIIPTGVVSIGEFAFGDCQSLEAVLIPRSVVEIGLDAFFGTSAAFTLYGQEGSYVQEYAQMNKTAFQPATAFPSGNFEHPTEAEPEDLPPTVAEDEELKPTPGPAVTAEIAVRFPHAVRTGTYTGEMKESLAHGQGTFSALNDEGVGWTYQGAWENGAMNGFGAMTWSDGLAYEGYYRDSQPYNGKWLIDGASVYTGSFRMCPECGVTVFHGMGKLTNRLGRVIYEGQFDSGLLRETAQERQARAQALDPRCGTLTGDGYAAMMNAPDAGSGTLLRLEGRIGEILLDEEHGWGEFLLLNNGNAAHPIHVSYRYGAGEERVQTGRRATVWGTVTGLHRDTDSRGRERVMLQMDADVIQMGEEQAQRGLNEVVITARKVLDGRLLKNREFNFALDETFTVMEQRINPLDGTVTFVPVTFTARLQTRANDRDGTVAFDLIRYTADDIGGVFTYAVTEIPGFEPGMFYDPMVMTVTVIVGDNGVGRPVATVFYPDDTVFNNAVQPQDGGMMVLVADVTLEGRTLQDGEFQFDLMFPDGTVVDTKRNDATGRVTFDPIIVSLDTINSLLIRQVIGGEPGMEYDPMVIRVGVTETIDAAGFVRQTPVYPADTTFNNRVQAEAVPVIFEVMVELQGRPLQAGEFTFQLLEGDRILQTAVNDATGKVAFAKVDFSAADIGPERIFTVRQVPGDLRGVTYDSMEANFTVTNQAPVSGFERANIVGLWLPEDTTFNNVFSALAEVVIVFNVALEGRPIKNGEFSFQLLSDGGTLLETKRSDKDGRITFNPLEFSEADTGRTFSFTVKQVPGSETGMTYDTAAKAVNFQVSLDGGLLKAEVLYPADAAFNNRFVQPVSLPVLSRVDADKTSITAGETVIFTPIVSGGTKPYSYHYILYRDGKMIQDSGWVDIAVSRSKLGNPGVVQVQVTVQDSLGNRSQTVSSPRVSVQPVSLPVLSRVDADKTSITAGEAVTFTPIVSGGTKPYSYHYILYRDGKLIKDIGWVDNAVRRSQLSNPGVVRMQVEVKDAEGRLTQALMSPEVTVKKPAWSPKGLTGIWNVTKVITAKTGEKATTPVGTVLNYTLSIQMKDNNTGAVTSDWKTFAGLSGPLSYTNGSIKFVLTNEWNVDTYEGKVEIKDGIVTLSGTWFETKPKNPGVTYSATWMAVKEE